MNYSIAEQVVEILYKDRFILDAKELEGLLEKLSADNEQERIDAAKKIQALCGIKSLEDRAVTSVDYHTWGKMLQKLHKYAGKRLKRS